MKADLFLSIQIAGIKGRYKVLQTLCPIPWFEGAEEEGIEEEGVEEEDAEEGDNILTGGILSEKKV